MGVKAKGAGLAVGMFLLTVVLLLFIWAVARVGMILASFLAGVVVGFCCGIAVKNKGT
jgi:multisubunit Na+/H+ antiporter MnhE subunit